MAIISGSAQSFLPVASWANVGPTSGQYILACTDTNNRGQFFDGNSGYPQTGGLLMGYGQPVSGAGQFYAPVGSPLNLRAPFSIMLVEKIDGLPSGGSSRTVCGFGSGIANDGGHLTLNSNTTESFRLNNVNLSTFRTGLGTHIGIARLATSGRASFLVGSLLSGGLVERITVSGGLISGYWGSVSVGASQSQNGPQTQILEMQFFNQFISDADCAKLFSGARLEYGTPAIAASGKLVSTYAYNFDAKYSYSGAASTFYNAACTASGSQNYWPVIGGSLVTSGLYANMNGTNYAQQEVFQNDHTSSEKTIELVFRTGITDRSIISRENAYTQSASAYTPNAAVTANGNFAYRQNNTSGDYKIFASGLSRVNDSNFHYGVITVSSGQFKTYIDGYHQVILSGVGGTPETFNGGWRIGTYRGGGIAADGLFQGDIGIFRVQNSAMTSGEIFNTYNNEIVPRYRTKTFQYTSGLQTFDLTTLPSGTTTLSYTAVGARGGNAVTSGSQNWGNNRAGGNGGRVTGSINISGRTQLFVAVGGYPAQSRLPVYGGALGGNGGIASGASYIGGAGGSATTIAYESSINSGNVIVVAAGGGGAAGVGGSEVVNGGNACVPSGSNNLWFRGANGYNSSSGTWGFVGGFGGGSSGNIYSGSLQVGGRGGIPFDTQIVAPTSGTYFIGGNGGTGAGYNGGGGGGGGFGGGGGGAAGGNAAGGGGAGGSFVKSGVASGQFFNSFNSTGHGSVSFSW